MLLSRLLLPLGLGASVILVPAVPAATVKDREGAVRQDKATMENDARWIYNDVDRGFAEAKKTGKPLLVVLRCVPCLSCVGLDAGVLKDDLIVAIDGRTTRATEGELIGQLLQTRKARENVDVTVLRGTERVTLPSPMQ